MFLRNQAEQKIQRARRQLAFQIESYGVWLHFYESVYTSDGMNGKLQSGSKKKTVKGIITATGQSGGDMNKTDSGRKRSQTHTLTLLYDKHHRPEYWSEFWTHDNKQYKVVSCDNVDNADLYFSIGLKYTDAYMEGYYDGGKERNEIQARHNGMEPIRTESTDEN